MSAGGHPRPAAIDAMAVIYTVSMLVLLVDRAALRQPDAAGHPRGRAARSALRDVPCGQRSSCAVSGGTAVKGCGGSATARAPPDGLRRRGVPRQAGDRDHQHLERHQPLPHPFRAARGGGQARRLAGRRVPGGDARRCRCREPFQKPTTMLYRNLLAMETEELLRSYPVDGAVLMGGCDKTTPALLMGAISDGPAGDLPARRADAARRLARRDARQRQRHLEVLGRAARRQHHARRTGRRSRTASPARPGTA